MLERAHVCADSIGTPSSTLISSHESWTSDLVAVHMRCLNTRTEGQAHDLETINIRSEQALREPKGILHFNAECRTCFSSYWQHGSEIVPDRWKLKPATCDCGFI